MKLGIMSDSHGRADIVRQALTVLKEAGTDMIVHCGDIGGPEVFEALAGWNVRFVWGNSDHPSPSWRPALQALQLPWPDGPVELGVDGKRIAVFHGHEMACHRAIGAARHDYLLHGHTHQPDDYRIGDMRVINPGALHDVPIRTVALLDPATDTLHFLGVEDDAPLDPGDAPPAGTNE